MIITIVDYPNRNHSDLLQELYAQEAIVLSGDIQELKKQTNELKEKNTRSLIFWDYPTIIEDGYAHCSDKLLKISYAHPLLTEEEKVLDEKRNKPKHDVYILHTPSSTQITTKKERTKRELSMIVRLSTYKRDWLIQQTTKQMSDEEIRECALEIFQKNGLEKTTLFLESDSSSTFLANYIHERNAITLNPILLRKGGYDNKRDLTFLLAHEFGHLIDPDIVLLIEQKAAFFEKLEQATTIEEIETYTSLLEEVILKAENNAYDNCYQFLDSSFLKEEIEEDRKRNEEAYKIRLKKEKEERIHACKKAQFYV